MQRPRGDRGVLEPRRRRGLSRRRVAVRATRTLSWEDLLGHPAQPHARRVARVRRRAARRAAADRGAGRARDHGHGQGPDRRLGLPRVPRPRAVRGAPRRLDGHLVPLRAGLQPVREPGQRAALRRRPEHDGAAGDRGHVRGRQARRDDGRVRPALRARPAAARRPQADRDHAARRRLVHARRPRADVAELVAAARLQPPRRARPAHARLRRAQRRAPHLAGRDGRPLPRPLARPLPPHRLRHRRVGPRLHDASRSSSAATAWARSATSTPSCTTRPASRT